MLRPASNFDNTQKTHPQLAFIHLHYKNNIMGMTVNPPFHSSPSLKFPGNLRQKTAGGRPSSTHRCGIITHQAHYCCYLKNPKQKRRPFLFIRSYILPPISAASASTTTTSSDSRIQLTDFRDNSSKWEWKGHSINYFVYKASQETPSNPPVLLVHGFGASIPHWRKNIKVIAQNRTVFAIDLLGFGDSDKPTGYEYTMEKWAKLILDFLNEIVQKPTVLIGNSVGSLACVIAAADSCRSLIQGLVLLNCAGGMNNKAIVNDWRIKLLLPLLWFIDFLLKQKAIASFIFQRVKQRENLKNILLSVYANKESVDDELVEIINSPADAEGALDAFVAIVTGPPGPNPVQLMPKITVPVLVLWGDEDPFTPLDGPVGRYFSSLPSQASNVSLSVLNGVGHCPHDDRPELVHEKLLPWLAHLPAS